MELHEEASDTPDTGEHGLICWATAVLILADATDVTFSNATISCASDILNKSLTTRDRNRVVKSLSSNPSINPKNIKLHLPNSSFYLITKEWRASKSKGYDERMAQALEMRARGQSYKNVSEITDIPAGTLRSRQSRLNKKKH